MSSPYLGIFCSVNEEYALIPTNSPTEFKEVIKKELDVDPVETTMAGTNLIGVFSAMNSEKIIVPDILEKEEMNVLKEIFSEVIVLEEKFTALGNMITMNDHGIVCSEPLKEILKEAEITKVAGSDFVGSCVFSTNTGFMTHPDALEKEIKVIEKALKVKGGIGTVNFGDPYVKTGMIGNSKGILVGKRTSGPELKRIDEIFILR